jgi:hypothetical protein
MLFVHKALFVDALVAREGEKRFFVVVEDP